MATVARSRHAVQVGNGGCVCGLEYRFAGHGPERRFWARTGAASYQAVPVAGGRCIACGRALQRQSVDGLPLLYEVELHDGTDVEVRLTETPLEVGATIQLARRSWVVERRIGLLNAPAESRYVCVAEPSPDATVVGAASPRNWLM